MEYGVADKHRKRERRAERRKTTNRKYIIAFVLCGSMSSFYNFSSVWMKDIQNKIIKHLLYTFMGYIITKGNYRSFSEYIIFSIHFNVSFLDITTNIQMIFDLVPSCLKYVWCYRSHSVPYASFQMLKVVDLNLCSSHNPTRKNPMVLNLAT
jgi:uncharacterized membrane protein